MTDLSWGELKLPGRRLGKAAEYPAIREQLAFPLKTALDDSDGLFVNYGKLFSRLPYTMQDNYDGPTETLTYRTVILENQWLKAVFVPEFGGRLWSLFDKRRRRDLILENQAILPCNLAIRNAWLAGGVEFNCGRAGHDAQTMSPRFTAIVDTPEYPVLRFYEFQRDREVPFQYDCFLPDDSPRLYIRVRIWNPHDQVIPMYWWSNIAEPEIPGSRVIVPASEAYCNCYGDNLHILQKLRLPAGEGFDATYPDAFPEAKDHFYRIPAEHRKYECLMFPDGYGLSHVSTRRLIGRKLFVWGQGVGGRHWNHKLLRGEYAAYLEIQAGLAHTQLECLPMPPRTAWEWLEGYGAIELPPELISGSWSAAVAQTTAYLDQQIPADQLESLLETTRNSIALKPGKVMLNGSGWGALEELRRGEKLAPQLDFGTPGVEQAAWVELVEHHRMAERQPISYLISSNWFELLRQAEPSGTVHYHLALNYYWRRNWLQAQEELFAIPDWEHHCRALHLLANICRQLKQYDKAAQYIVAAGKLVPQDISFQKEAMRMLQELKNFTGMSELFQALPQTCIVHPLLRLFKCFALAHTGNLDEAEKLLVGDGPWDIPDIREGENSTSELYCYIQEQRAKLKHQNFEPTQVKMPYYLDLRMAQE